MLREIARRVGKVQLALEVRSVIDVDQFYGIEIGDFPARIAATALWMMDHIMNNRLSLEFGQTYARIPIEKSPHIRNADALEIDWGRGAAAEVRAPTCFSSAIHRSEEPSSSRAEQRAQVRRVAALGGSGGSLDYVAAWFIRAGEYVRRARNENETPPPRIGFVATNSVTQGEQVAQLWPILFERHNLQDRLRSPHVCVGFGRKREGGPCACRYSRTGLVLRTLDPTNVCFSYQDLQAEPLESSHTGDHTLPPRRQQFGRFTSRCARGEPTYQWDASGHHRLQTHRRRATTFSIPKQRS